ncbi:MAG: hypothetical protein U9N35_06505 [Euryarchaeota archaeon]|nr:hypothetical protein [Euryarchaeota archaeon]
MVRRKIKKENNLQNIYIDTFYIEAYLIGNKIGQSDTQKEAKDLFQKISKTITNPNIKVVIPFIVLGELINNINREISGDVNKNKIFFKFWKLINRLIKADFSPPRGNFIPIAKRVMEKDDKIEPADLHIVAQALEDPNSSFLLTTDSKIIESYGIKSLEKEMRDSNERKQKLQRKEAKDFLGV